MNSRYIYKEVTEWMNKNEYNTFTIISFMTVNGLKTFTTKDFNLEYNDWHYKICRDLLNEK